MKRPFLVVLGLALSVGPLLASSGSAHGQGFQPAAVTDQPSTVGSSTAFSAPGAAIEVRNSALPGSIDSLTDGATRLEPPISEQDGVPAGQVPPANQQVFRDDTVSINYAGGPICLSSDSGSCKPVAADDAFRIYVNGELKIDHQSYTHDYGPISFSELLRVGNNQVRIQLIDLLGPERGGSAFWLVPSSGGAGCPLAVGPGYDWDSEPYLIKEDDGCCTTWGFEWQYNVKFRTCSTVTVTPHFNEIGSKVKTIDFDTPSGSMTVNNKGDPIGATVNGPAWADNQQVHPFLGVNIHTTDPRGPYIVKGWEHKIGTLDSIGLDFADSSTEKYIWSPHPPRRISVYVIEVKAVVVAYYFSFEKEVSKAKGLVPAAEWGTVFLLLKQFFQEALQLVEAGALFEAPSGPVNLSESMHVAETLAESNTNPVNDDLRSAVATKYGEMNSAINLVALNTNRTRASAYTTITYNGDGFTPNGEVMVTIGPLHGEDIDTQFILANSVGHITGTIEMPGPNDVQLGPNVLAAVDYRTMKQSVDTFLDHPDNPLYNYMAAQLIDVVTDTTPPVTTISLSGTPGSNGWYISPVQGGTLATDDLSGVAATYISVNGAAFTQAASVSLPAEGVHTVDFYSVDKVGNVETTNHLTVKIDWTPPRTTAFVVGPKDSNGLLRDSVVVAFVVYDNVSGKWYTEYAGIDGTEAWTKLYGEQDRFTIDKNGVFRFRYRSVDNAGNQEVEHDSGPLIINKWLVYCTGSDQCIQLSGNLFGKITGDFFSNGNYGITGNIQLLLTGLLKSANSGSVVSGNSLSTIPAIQAGSTAVALGPYPTAYYLARANRIYNTSTTFNSINEVFTGVVYVKGDVTLKTIKVSGNVVMVAEGNIYDQSITNAFVSDDPSNGIVLYSMKDVRLKNIGSKFVGLVYAPNGSIIIDGPVNFVLRGSLVARKVQIMNTSGFDARYDAAIQSGTYQLPLNSIANPPIGSGPTATAVVPSTTPSPVPASATPTQLPSATPTASRTSTAVPTLAATATASRTPTSVPATATPAAGPTATPCSGVQPPTLLTPANGSAAGTLRPTLSWQAATGAFYTQVQLSTDATFTTGVTAYETISNSYTPSTNLQAHTTLYWRARSRDIFASVYTNCWSTVWSFTTP